MQNNNNEILLQRMSFHLLSLLSSMLKAIFPCTFAKWRLMPQTSESVLGGYRFPVCFVNSQMNLQSQKFKLFADMCSSWANKSSTSIISSPFPPTVSNGAFFVHSRVLPGSKNVHYPLCVVFRIFRYCFRV